MEMEKQMFGKQRGHREAFGLQVLPGSVYHTQPILFVAVSGDSAPPGPGPSSEFF